MAALEPKDMIGQMFLLNDGNDGQRFQTQVIQVIVKGGNGESTREWLEFIVIDDPMTCTAYTKKHGLLSPPGRNRFGTEFMEDDVGTAENTKSLSTSQESSYLLMQVLNCLNFCFILRGTSRATIYMLDMIYLEVALLNNFVHRITVSKCCENRSLHKKCHNFLYICIKDKSRPANKRPRCMLSFEIFTFCINASQCLDSTKTTRNISNNTKYTPSTVLIMQHPNKTAVQTQQHLPLADLRRNTLIGHMSPLDRQALSYEHSYDSHQPSISASSLFLYYITTQLSDFSRDTFNLCVLMRQ
jgi:hypothetical protein